jgi:hypothetical protein
MRCLRARSSNGNRAKICAESTKSSGSLGYFRLEPVALGRETEAMQTAERCETITGDHLRMKQYDEHWNHWMLAFCARFLGRKEEAYQHMHLAFVNGDVAFLGWLPDGPSLQVFKPDQEFQAILSERNRQNVGKRARIIALEKSQQ